MAALSHDFGWSHLDQSSERIPFAHRLLGPGALALLFSVTLVNLSVFAEALYLRAHKQEKFLHNSVLTGCLVAASTLLLGRTYGAIGMITGYFVVSLFLSLGLGTFTFIKYRRICHAE